jgi:hypothetical protein
MIGSNSGDVNLTILTKMSTLKKSIDEFRVSNAQNKPSNLIIYLLNEITQGR